MCLGKVKSPALQLSTSLALCCLHYFQCCSELHIHLVPAGLFVNQGFKWSRKKMFSEAPLIFQATKLKPYDYSSAKVMEWPSQGRSGHPKCPVWRHTAKYLKFFCELLCWHRMDILCAWSLPVMTTLRRGRQQCPPCLNLISNMRCDSAAVSHRHHRP